MLKYFDDQVNFSLSARISFNEVKSGMFYLEYSVAQIWCQRTTCGSGSKLVVTDSPMRLRRMRGILF
jgi:hypothetical protein